jgi:hypothetical protein
MDISFALNVNLSAFVSCYILGFLLFQLIFIISSTEIREM